MEAYSEKWVRRGFLVVLVLCLFGGLSSIGYLWHKNQIYTLGERIRELERDLKQHQRDNENLRQDHATLSSPPEIIRLVRKLGMDLVEPEPGRIIRIPDPRRSMIGAEGTVPGRTALRP